MLRFSLLSLLGAVLLVSIGCAALASASDIWTKAITTATILALLVATVGALALPAGSRAFAAGSASCGWIYLLLVQGPWFEALKPELATTAALNQLVVMMHPDAIAASPYVSATRIATQQLTTTSTITIGSGMGPASGGIVYTTPTVVPAGAWAGANVAGNFQHIGQSLWTLLLACGGGMLARLFAGSRARTAPPVTQVT
jgi:hypothetical protein